MKNNKPKLILTIVLFALVLSVIVVDLISIKASIVEASSFTKEIAACTDEIKITYDEANNDWIISPVSIGSCYTVPEDLRTVWNSLFGYPDILSRFAEAIVKTGRGMTLKEITQRVVDSTQIGYLNLIK